MGSPDVKIEVNLLTDEQFETRTRPDILAGVAVPDAARDYVVGPRSLLVTAVGQGGIVVACASGALLEHSTKPPLLYIVASSANSSHTGQGLEYRLVVAMYEAADNLGVAGVWFCDEVATMVKATAASQPATTVGGEVAVGAHWWHRLWPPKAK